MINENKEQKTYAERRYKDTIFRRLFSDKRSLLSLYNALNETHYDNPNDIEINTLEGVIYLTRKNDISFILDFRMNLYEHQATFNPNMPLRDLMYISKLYEKFIVGLDIYNEELIKIPTPRFVVFYNGTNVQPERVELRLSDAFIVQEEEISLELKVTMININLGNNNKLLEACPLLYEYMVYVGKVREYEKEMALSDAVVRAVDECIKAGILTEFLLQNKSEAINMSIFEFDEELHEKTLKEIGRKEGRKEAIIGALRIMEKIKLPKNEIIEELMETYNLSEEEIEELF